MYLTNHPTKKLTSRYTITPYYSFTIKIDSNKTILVKLVDNNRNTKKKKVIETINISYHIYMVLVKIKIEN